MENGKLSVIVPVYEAEDYLEPCVRSILNSSYRKIELILVDDGSPDRSPLMCDAFAQEDDRVIVVHQNNAGGGYARNTGIKIATGEYIAFCDNDDVVPKEAYELLMTRAIETNADIVRGTVERTYEDTGDVRLWIRKADDPINTLVIGLLGGIYKTSFLLENNLFFTDMKMGPDLYFMVQAIDCAHRMEYMENVTYQYKMRKSNSKVTSAMQKANSNFDYYYDDFVWREKMIRYIYNSPKLNRKYGNQVATFCKYIDRNWFNFATEQREQCFEVLQKTMKLVRWEEQSHQAREYLHIKKDEISNITEKQYSKLLRKNLWKEQVRRKAKEVIMPLYNGVKCAKRR